MAAQLIPFDKLNDLAGDTPKYTLLTVDDMARQAPQTYRIKPVFPETGIAAIFGPSGSGKSFLAFDMAGAIAGRADWFGYRVKNGPVVCLVLEGEGGLRNRIAAYRTRHGGDALAAVRFIVRPFDMLATDPGGLVQAIDDAGMERPTIFVDTLNRAAPGADENSSVDMGRIISACKALQAAVGGLVVLVHHSGKNAAMGMRGHSSLFAALDAVIQVTRDGDRREWTLTKSKDGRDGEAHGFSLETVDLGADDDGDRITSCVVEAAGYDDGADRPKPPLGGNQKIIYDYLKETLAHRHAVPVLEIIEAVRGRLVCDDKRKPERIRAALTAMINIGLLACADDAVFFPVSFPVSRSYINIGNGNGKEGNSRNLPVSGKTGNGKSAGQAEGEGRCTGCTHARSNHSGEAFCVAGGPIDAQRGCAYFETAEAGQ